MLLTGTRRAGAQQQRGQEGPEAFPGFEFQASARIASPRWAFCCLFPLRLDTLFFCLYF